MALEDGRPGDLRLAQMYAAGETLAEIGTLLGISRERVRQRLDRLGIPRRKPFRSGANSPSARERYREGRRAVLLAKLQSLSRQLKRTPGQRDLCGKNGRPWFVEYYSVFGSLRAAQIAAGLVPNEVGNRRVG